MIQRIKNSEIENLGVLFFALIGLVVFDFHFNETSEQGGSIVLGLDLIANLQVAQFSR